MSVELVGRAWKNDGRDVVYDEPNRAAIIRYLDVATNPAGDLTVKFERAKLDYLQASRALRDGKAVLHHLRNLPEDRVVRAAKQLRRIAFGAKDNEWDGLSQERKDFYLAEARELLASIGVDQARESLAGVQ